MRIPCTKCGAEILASTAKVTGGVCAPCAKGAGLCSVCGERVWEANQAGEFVHFDCADKRRDRVVVASTGISWAKPGDVDWDALRDGILAATRSAFARIAVAHPERPIKDVTVAHRIGEGVRVEPCVTFSDGEYINASLDDDELYEDLEPFDRAITRIEESLDDEQSELFIETLEARIPILMAEVFKTLETERFGLVLADGCVKTLKDF